MFVVKRPTCPDPGDLAFYALTVGIARRCHFKVDVGGGVTMIGLPGVTRLFYNMSEAGLEIAQQCVVEWKAYEDYENDLFKSLDIS